MMMMMIKHFGAAAAVVGRKQDWIGAEKLPAKETCSFATKKTILEEICLFATTNNYLERNLMFATKNYLKMHLFFC